MSHPPKISREAVVQASLAIIDEEGVADLSMGAIANRLGVRGPSLYNHFANKAEILSQVVRWIILEVPVAPLPPERQWRDWLVSQSVNMRRAILRHPNMAGLLFEYFPRESIAPAYHRASAFLELANVPRERHLVIFEGIDRLTLGSALYAAQQQAHFENGSSRATPIPGRQALMTAHDWDEEGLFVEILRSFLAGVCSEKDLVIHENSSKTA